MDLNKIKAWSPIRWRSHPPDYHFDWVHALWQTFAGWNRELKFAVFVRDLCPHVLPLPVKLVHDVNIHLPKRDTG